MHPLLPMSLDNLEALIMEMMILRMAASSVKYLMACVQSRHRMCGLAPPILQAQLFARMFKAIASMVDMSKKIIGKEWKVIILKEEMKNLNNMFLNMEMTKLEKM
jgi:hypothetical protein